MASIHTQRFDEKHDLVLQQLEQKLQSGQECNLFDIQALMTLSLHRFHQLSHCLSQKYKPIVALDAEAHKKTFDPTVAAISIVALQVVLAVASGGLAVAPAVSTMTAAAAQTCQATSSALSQGGSTALSSVGGIVNSKQQGNQTWAQHHVTISKEMLSTLDQAKNQYQQQEERSLQQCATEIQQNHDAMMRMMRVEG